MQGPAPNLGTWTHQRYLIWLPILIKIGPDDYTSHTYLACRWSGPLPGSSLRGKHTSSTRVPQQKAGRCENRGSSNKNFLLKVVNPHRQIINGVILMASVCKKRLPYRRIAALPAGCLAGCTATRPIGCGRLNSITVWFSPCHLWARITRLIYLSVQYTKSSKMVIAWGCCSTFSQTVAKKKKERDPPYKYYSKSILRIS